MSQVKRMLGATATIAITEVLMGLFVGIALYSRVSPFRNYAGLFWPGAGISNADSALSVLFAPAPLLVLLLFLLWNAAVWMGADRLADSRIHRLDYYYTVLITVLILIPNELLFIYFRQWRLAHIALGAIAFFCLAHLWMTTLVRLRARRLKATIHWFRIFRILPMNRFLGIFVLLIVSAVTLFFFYGSFTFAGDAAAYVYEVDMDLRSWLETWFLDHCLPVFIVALISILCGDIIRLTEAKERAAEQRMAAERFRTELIANVTHDIRTPLTSIINYVDFIEQLDIDNPELRGYVGVLNNKTARLKTLVSDLLEASKASTGNVPIRLETIDLIELIGQVAGDYDDVFRAASLSYVSPDSARRISIRADGPHLYRVLENLFSNVAKYAMPDTRVYVGVEEMESEVALRIKNISKKQLNISPEELMQQFVRGEQSRTTEGSGLGLYIADRLTELMGGHFEIAISGDLFEAGLRLPRDKEDIF